MLFKPVYLDASYVRASHPGTYVLGNDDSETMGVITNTGFRLWVVLVG